MNHAKPSLVRFSLRTLLVLMMLVCIALATTVSASPRVEYAMRWALALAPAIAILLAAATSDAKRAFWLGFAAFSFWAYVHNSEKSEVGKIAGQFCASRFHSHFRDHLAELHQPRIEADAIERLRGFSGYIFAQNPGITRDEIERRFSQDYQLCRSSAISNVTGISSTIAWHHLLLAFAMVGGMAVAQLTAWRNRRTCVNQEPAGINPATR